MRKILPKILAFITGRERYLPRDIEWVKGNWTHNIFRAWEVVFWRAFGPNGIGDTIRCESTTEAWKDEKGNLHVHRSFYTLEAVVAHAEGIVRRVWKEAWEPKPQYGFMPQPVFLTMMVLGLKLSFQGDLNGMLAPLIGGAIAYDSSSKNIGTTNSLTVSHTTSGSNRLLITGGVLQDNTRSWTSVEYNGVGTTQIGSNFTYTANNAPGQMRYLIAPATGTNNTVFTCSGSIQMRGIVASYTGCLQSGVPDGTAQGNGGSSFNVTVTAANCWMVSVTIGFNNDFDTPGASYVTLAGALTTLRQYYDDGLAYADSNGTVSTGSVAVQWTGLKSNNGRIAASIAPLATTQYDQTVTATVTPAASFIRQVSKTMAVTSTVSASVLKQLTQTFNVTATATASMFKQMAKTFDVTATVSAALEATKVYLLDLDASLNISATLTKVPGKLLDATSTITATLTKTISTSKILEATANVTASLTKGLSKTLGATTTIAASLTKIPGKLLEASTAITATIDKIQAKVLEATVNVSASLEAGRAVVMNATTTVTAEVSKQVGKLLSVTATITAKILAPFWRTKYPAHGDEDDYEIKYPHD